MALIEDREIEFTCTHTHAQICTLTPVKSTSKVPVVLDLIIGVANRLGLGSANTQTDRNFSQNKTDLKLGHVLIQQGGDTSVDSNPVSETIPVCMWTYVLSSHHIVGSDG